MGEPNKKNLSEAAEQNELRVSDIFSKGYGILPKTVMLCTELTIEAKAIYAYFCSYAGNGNDAFPSRDRIIADLTISKDTYYKHFNYLVDKGLVTVRQEKGTGNAFGKNVYILSSTPNLNGAVADDNVSSTTYIELEGTVDGFGIMPKLVMTDRDLNIKAKGIYAYFCSFAGAGRAAFPKQKNTLYHLGINKTTYSKYLFELFSRDYIRLVQRDYAGRFLVKTYVLTQNFQKGAENSTTKPEEIGTEKSRVQDADKVEMESVGTEKVKSSDTKISDTAPDLESLGTRKSKFSDTKISDTGLNLEGVGTEKVKSSDTKISDTKISDTKISDTKISDTNNNSIRINSVRNNNPSTNRVDDDVRGDEIEVSEEECRAGALARLRAGGSLAEELCGSLTEMITAIQYASSRDFWLKEYKPNTQAEELERSTNLMFTEALIGMVTPRRSPFVIDEREVSFRDIKTRLVELCDYTGRQGCAAMGTIQERACAYYMAAAQDKEIKAPIPYMRSCIWSAMQEGNIDAVSFAARYM